MSIVDIRGKRVKSKWAKQQEEMKWKPCYLHGFCRLCGFEFQMVAVEPVNIFRIPCGSPTCEGRKSFAAIVPREFYSNFMPKPPTDEPVLPRPAA